jgi:hypothetical protein
VDKGRVTKGIVDSESSPVSRHEDTMQDTDQFYDQNETPDLLS